jgi:hypothetical protein
MEQLIVENLHNPEKLESLYRSERSQFKKAFDHIYVDHQHEPSVKFWQQRLHYSKHQTVIHDKKEINLILIVAIISGIIANLPKLLGMETDVFLQTNIGFVVFPMLMVYFGWKNNITPQKLILPLIAVIASAFYINRIPQNEGSDTFILAVIHLPIFLWSLLGYTWRKN